MSGKIITVAVATILLASTAIASAQTIANPRYWGGGGYYGPGTPDYPPPRGFAPDYYNYAPDYEADNWGTWGENW